MCETVSSTELVHYFKPISSYYVRVFFLVGIMKPIFLSADRKFVSKSLATPRSIVCSVSTYLTLS